MGVSGAFSVIFLGVVNTDLPVVAHIGVLMKPANTLVQRCWCFGTK